MAEPFGGRYPPVRPSLQPGPEAPAWRQVAGSLGRLLEGVQEGLEAAPPALRPAAFLPWFLLNLQHTPAALERLESQGMRERYSSPSEVEAGAPTLRTPAGDLAQVAFTAGGVTPTAQLARGALRLPGAALSELASVGPRASQRGVVKLPGGPFDLKSFGELKEAIARGAGKVPNPRSEDGLESWIDRAVNNYVRKYMGQANDPLRTMEIGPSSLGPGTGTWEDMTDRLIAPMMTKYDPTASLETKLNSPTQVRWGLKEAYYPPLSGLPPDYPFKIPSGLSERVQAHRQAQREFEKIGQYMGSEVDPSKFLQYDLTRAAKEAQATDFGARAAAQLESMKELPVVKEYPDTGWRWVEHTVPQDLTMAQRNRIRPATSRELEQAKLADEEGEFWVYLDHEGKPTWDKYNDRLAVGDSPQHAWTAGKMAEEGNLIDNCVGAYCEDITSGKRRIMSLRDEKGDSHVTLGVAKRNKVQVHSLADDLEYLFHPDEFEALHREYEVSRWAAHAAGDTRRQTMGLWLMENKPEIVRRFETKTPELGEIEGKRHSSGEKYQEYIEDLRKHLGGVFEDTVED